MLYILYYINDKYVLNLCNNNNKFVIFNNIDEVKKYYMNFQIEFFINRKYQIYEPFNMNLDHMESRRILLFSNFSSFLMLFTNISNHKELLLFNCINSICEGYRCGCYSTGSTMSIRVIRRRLILRHILNIPLVNNPKINKKRDCQSISNDSEDDDIHNDNKRSKSPKQNEVNKFIEEVNELNNSDESINNIVQNMINTLSETQEPKKITISSNLFISFFNNIVLYSNNLFSIEHLQYLFYTSYYQQSSENKFIEIKNIKENDSNYTSNINMLMNIISNNQTLYNYHSNTNNKEIINLEPINNNIIINSNENTNNDDIFSEDEEQYNILFES
jgi:hypothetical protein